MLITSLLPLLSRYSLGLDLIAGPDDTVTLTIIPRKTEGGKRTLDSAEVRPIAITATAAEIDAELALGEAGALGQLFAVRKGLADQLVEQTAAAEAARTKTAKPAPAPKPAPTKTGSAHPEPVEGPTPGLPAKLF